MAIATALASARMSKQAIQTALRSRRPLPCARRPDHRPERAFFAPPVRPAALGSWPSRPSPGREYREHGTGVVRPVGGLVCPAGGVCLSGSGQEEVGESREAGGGGGAEEGSGGDETVGMSRVPAAPPAPSSSCFTQIVSPVSAATAASPPSSSLARFVPLPSPFSAGAGLLLPPSGSFTDAASSPAPPNLARLLSPSPSTAALPSPCTSLARFFVLVTLGLTQIWCIEWWGGAGSGSRSERRRAWRGVSVRSERGTSRSTQPPTPVSPSLHSPPARLYPTRSL